MFLDKIKKIKTKQLKKNKSPKRDIFEIFSKNDFSIIAEIKKASPSKGDICPNADILKIASEYLNNGATALSILTETVYFKGNIEYLKQIRQEYSTAILLRKDFIIDSFQIYEAKFAGADIILLILALTCLEKARELIKISKAIGLEVLLEVHSEEEMQKALKLDINFIGVNNRNLKTLEVSLDISKSLAKYINKDKIFICESGINSASEMNKIRDLGYNGVLIGSHFMELPSPGEGLKKFLEGIND